MPATSHPNIGCPARPTNCESTKQIKEKKSVLAQYETMDCGKPIDEAEWDMVSHGPCTS